LRACKWASEQAHGLDKMVDGLDKLVDELHKMVDELQFPGGKACEDCRKLADECVHMEFSESEVWPE